MTHAGAWLPAGMIEADLGIKSIPRNPLLFGMLHRMEAVEHIGSGIRRIRRLCREYGVAEPRIEVSEHWFTLSFPRPALEQEEQTARQAAAIPGGTEQVGTKSQPESHQSRWGCVYWPCCALKPWQNQRFPVG